MTVRALPGWASATVYIGGGVFGGAIVAMSSVAQWSLAIDAGWNAVHAAAPPIAFDACAGVAGVLWAFASGALQAWGKWTTWGFIAASMVCNAAASLSGFGLLPYAVLVWLFVLIPAGFPLVAGLVAHLLLMVRRAEDEAVQRDAEHAQAVAQRNAEHAQAVAAALVLTSWTATAKAMQRKLPSRPKRHAVTPQPSNVRDMRPAESRGPQGGLTAAERQRNKRERDRARAAAGN